MRAVRQNSRIIFQSTFLWKVPRRCSNYALRSPIRSYPPILALFSHICRQFAYIGWLRLFAPTTGYSRPSLARTVPFNYGPMFKLTHQNLRRESRARERERDNRALSRRYSLRHCETGINWNLFGFKRRLNLADQLNCNWERNAQIENRISLRSNVRPSVVWHSTYIDYYRLYYERGKNVKIIKDKRTR